MITSIHNLKHVGRVLFYWRKSIFTSIIEAAAASLVITRNRLQETPLEKKGACGQGFRSRSRGQQARTALQQPRQCRNQNKQSSLTVSPNEDDELITKVLDPAQQMNEYAESHKNNAEND